MLSSAVGRQSCWACDYRGDVAVCEPYSKEGGVMAAAAAMTSVGVVEADVAGDLLSSQDLEGAAVEVAAVDGVGADSLDAAWADDSSLADEVAAAQAASCAADDEVVEDEGVKMADREGQEAQTELLADSSERAVGNIGYMDLEVALIVEVREAVAVHNLDAASVDGSNLADEAAEDWPASCAAGDVAWARPDADEASAHLDADGASERRGEARVVARVALPADSNVYDAGDTAYKGWAVALIAAVHEVVAEVDHRRDAALAGDSNHPGAVDEVVEAQVASCVADGALAAADHDEVAAAVAAAAGGHAMVAWVAAHNSADVEVAAEGMA